MARGAIERFDSANSVTKCDPFFASLRYRAFMSPNCRLITRNGCPASLRTDAFLRSATASADPGASTPPSR